MDADDAGQTQTAKKQMKLSYSEYHKMANLIVHYLREKEAAAETEGAADDDQVSRNTKNPAPGPSTRAILRTKRHTIQYTICCQRGEFTKLKQSFKQRFKICLKKSHTK
jgi:hypothetical protein